MTAALGALLVLGCLGLLLVVVYVIAPTVAAALAPVFVVAQLLVNAGVWRHRRRC